MEDWRPVADSSALRARATLLAEARAFFAARAVLEVETPALAQRTVTEPAVESIAVDWQRERWYLQTSPEYAMKRLLAAGVGDIFQICKVFRGGERGARHNPEFSMLEWYRRGVTFSNFIDENVALLQTLFNRDSAARHWTYRELLQSFTQVDPFTANDGQLIAALIRNGIDIENPAALPRAVVLDLLYDHATKATTTGIHTVCDFPPTAAALARIEQDANGITVARRCELIVDGVEVGNGYHELTDDVEQRKRFAKDRARRRAADQEDIALDERLLAALAAGLPDCCGMAIGLDRVLMLRLGARHIDEVLAFPTERA